MANSQGSFKIITIAVLLSFIFGIFGSVVSDRWVIPYMYKNYSSFITPESSRTIVEPTRVVEKISESSIIEASKNVSASVVSIVVTKDLPTYYRNPFNLFFEDPLTQNPNQNQPQTQKREIGGGTGFIVTSDGLILTNKHVVDDTEAEYTVIMKDGTEYKAEVVTKDPLNDMAIVRMLNKDGAKVLNVPAVKFLPNIESIQVGQIAIAIGNALAEFNNSVTVGVVSAQGRDITASGTFQSNTETLKDLIQTDASINPGNSGGPLVNSEGEVMGMNTAIASNAQGIGFAIPLDEKIINKILDQVQKYGKIVRPFLGVRYVTVTEAVNQEFNLGTNQGAWIRSQDDVPAVVANTPAADAGLQGGDIILKVNGKALTEKYQLQDAIATFNPEETIALSILRNGKEQDVKVKLEQREETTTN